MDYLIGDKRSNRRAASGDRVLGRGGGSPYSPIDRAPPPPQVPSFFENLNFPLPPIFSPFLVQFRKKNTNSQKLVSDVVFLFFFRQGGGGGQENNHLCILNLEFHIGAFMAPKL